MTEPRKIVTKYDPPPIPYDLGSPIGHGATESAAIADLKMEAGMDE